MLTGNHNSYQYIEYKSNCKPSQETVLYVQSQYLHIDAKGQVVYQQHIYQQFFGTQGEWNSPKATMYIQDEYAYSIAYRYNIPWNIHTVCCAVLLVFFFTHYPSYGIKHYVQYYPIFYRVDSLAQWQ